MPQPHIGQVYIDEIQTNISVAYMQMQTGFIATQVFPVVPVDRPTGKYFIFDKNDFMRDQMQVRPPGTESAGSGYRESTDGYSVDVFALHKDIDHQTRAASMPPNDPDRNATTWLTQMGLIKQEVQFANDYFKAGVWGTTKTGTTDFIKWSDYTSSDPIANIRAAIRQVMVISGMKPNRLVLGWDVWNILQDHPQFIDRISTTTTRILPEEMMANILGIDRVLVSGAVKATNVEGGSPNYDFIQGKHALVVYASPTPALDTPSGGYTFMWQGVSQGLGLNVGVTRFYIPEIKSDRLEIEMAWDNKVVAPDVGYFFENAVA